MLVNNIKTERMFNMWNLHRRKQLEKLSTLLRYAADIKNIRIGSNTINEIEHLATELLTHGSMTNENMAKGLHKNFYDFLVDDALRGAEIKDFLSNENESW